ncbi:MAG: cytochrome c biogenesis protein CcsA [Vicinamibacteria bacterium]|nr:cytochrome c biogenesis protein CcsA [Vicinamibacteria bacterium]
MRPLVTLIVSGALLLIIGSSIGLLAAPAERYMGDVQRIMYIHVPCAWMALLAFSYAFVSALFYLLYGGWRHDARLEAALEAGAIYSLLLCLQGALWAKPTWGVYWAWDPRLTTTAIMMFGFGGIIALRGFVREPTRRARWSAVAAIIAFVNVPLVYFSVRLWGSLHQLQSGPRSIAGPFLVPLGLNALGLVLLTSGLMGIRARAAWLRRERKMGPEAPDERRPLEPPVKESGGDA